VELAAGKRSNQPGRLKTATPAALTGCLLLKTPVLPYLALLLVPPELTMAVAFMMEQVGFDRLTEQDISIYAGPLSEPGGPHALIETADRIVPANLHRLIARYPTMSKPTLVVWCRHDSVVPLTSGQRLAATLPRARLAVLDTCDHLPSEQAPAALSRELRRFIGR
jgi:pimeloyl-ACP methyl ester carboxylesterase